MKSKIKYISTEMVRLQREVIHHTWHFNFCALFLMKDEKFNLYCSHVCTEKNYRRGFLNTNSVFLKDQS